MVAPEDISWLEPESNYASCVVRNLILYISGYKKFAHLAQDCKSKVE